MGQLDSTASAQLAMDTSSDYAGLALSRQGGVLAEMTWKTGQNHTTDLLPALVSLLERARTSLDSVDGIAVALGPGSFNGLRVGISTAKGLAFALGVPLVGVSTLEVEAFPFACYGLPVCAVHDAGRGEIATALFQSRDGNWQELEAPHITTLEGLIAEVSQPTVFCGELTSAMISDLESRLGTLACVPSPAAALRRAGLLAELGWQRLSAKRFDDPTTLEPIYLRRPPITTPRARSAPIRS